MIDNYDSFTYNLFQLFSQMNLEMKVFRHDAVALWGIRNEKADAIIISPGPKGPADSGISKEVVWEFKSETPVLGVCLGMQVINEVFGGKTVLAPRPVHGERDHIFHNQKGLFKSIPSPFLAARYHSLMIQVESDELEIISRNGDGIIMGVKHKHYPVYGVQFHPESFMTEYGREMTINFLSIVNEYGKHKSREKNRKNKGHKTIQNRFFGSSSKNKGPVCTL